MTDHRSMENAIKEGHRKYMDAGMAGEMDLVLFIAEALKEAGFIHKSALPTLNVEEVKQTLLDADLAFHQLPYTDDAVNEWLAFMAQAVCNKFTFPTLDVDEVAKLIWEHRIDSDTGQRCAKAICSLSPKGYIRTEEVN